MTAIGRDVSLSDDDADDAELQILDGAGTLGRRHDSHTNRSWSWRRCRDGALLAAASLSLWMSWRAQRRPCVVLRNASSVVRVVRGPDWAWADEDGHGEGTAESAGSGEVAVSWDAGSRGVYRLSRARELCVVGVVGASATELRQALEQLRSQQRQVDALEQRLELERGHRSRLEAALARLDASAPRLDGASKDASVRLDGGASNGAVAATTTTAPRITLPEGFACSTVLSPWRCCLYADGRREFAGSPCVSSILDPQQSFASTRHLCEPESWVRAHDPDQIWNSCPFQLPTSCGGCDHCLSDTSHCWQHLFETQEACELHPGFRWCRGRGQPTWWNRPLVRAASPSIQPLFDLGKDGIVVLLEMGNAVDVESLLRLYRNVEHCPWARSIPFFVLYDDRARHLDVLAKLSHKAPSAHFVDLLEHGLWTHPDLTAVPDGPGNHSLGYRMMCDLFATRIQRVARLLGLDYYLRLDADASLTCSESVQNPFLTMRQNGAVYGYVKTFVEAARYGVSMSAAVLDYAQTVPTSYSIFESIQWRDRHQSYWLRSPLFYNNIELVKVSYLEDPRVRRFTETVVEASKGIYGRRWGDAIIRYWQVVLFSGIGDVWCMTEFTKGIEYRHWPFLTTDDHYLHSCDLTPVPSE